MRTTSVHRVNLGAHDVAVVLGSGWDGVAGALGSPYVEVEGPPGITGHAGSVRSLKVGERRVLVYRGRTHLYEAPIASVVQSVRQAIRMGCSELILTNAAGGLREEQHVGDVVVISDHINLTATSPIVDEPRFVDMTDAYSQRLRAKATDADPSLTEGVYAAVVGPHYETPAEIRMMRAMGADLVGMSTVHECIAARQLGVEVLGLSLVTDLAGGTSGPIEHQDVLNVGRDNAERLGALLKAVLS